MALDGSLVLLVGRIGTRPGMRGPMRSGIWYALALLLFPLLASGEEGALRPEAREVHLAELRQLTRGGENAGAYWSPDGRQLVFQAAGPPFACDQIFRMAADGRGETVRVSTGKG